MNKKLSGAQMVLVPIARLGKNYLPEVQYLKGRFIKFIDFCQTTYLPDIAGSVGLSSTDDMFITIRNEQGNADIHYELPLERLDYVQTLGIRQPIFNKISMPNSYIDCQDANQIGKVAALMFYYDLPEYSAKNDIHATEVTDSVSILLTTETRSNAFPDDVRFTNKRFRKILLGKPTVTPDGHAALTDAQLKNCYVTLRRGTYNVVENMPLQLLYQLQMLEQSEWANIIFDFQNSFITIGGAGTIPNVQTDYIGKSVFMNLQYEAK